MRTIPAFGCCLAVSLVVAPATASRVSAQERPIRRGTLAGVVRDTSGLPLSFVHLTVALDSPRTALTDSAGAFQLDQLPVGIHRVLFRRLGYVPAEFQLLVLEGTTRRVVVELIAAPLLLDTITTPGSVSAYPVLERTGFYDRMRQARTGAGVGRFITPEDLEGVRALTKTTHILQTGGVRMLQSERGLSLWPVGAANILLQQGRIWGPCQMALFIDGAELDFGRYYEPSSGGGLDAYIQPSEIRAVEIYTSASGTPIQFQSVRNALCGSIVIWTKGN